MKRFAAGMAFSSADMAEQQGYGAAPPKSQSANFQHGRYQGAATAAAALTPAQDSERYAFEADWFDANAALVRKYTVLFFAEDSTVEIVCAAPRSQARLTV